MLQFVVAQILPHNLTLNYCDETTVFSLSAKNTDYRLDRQSLSPSTLSQTADFTWVQARLPTRICYILRYARTMCHQWWMRCPPTCYYYSPFAYASVGFRGVFARKGDT